MGMLKEFKDFAMKGNIVDLAVAVVIGTAFGGVVTALTNSLIMPLISMILGKEGVMDLSFIVNGTVFPIGVFLQAVINFIIIAFVLFLIIKAMNSMKEKKIATPAAPPEEIELLRQIRDALKK
jgi:large conductance mechanosensitive channel